MINITYDLEKHTHELIHYIKDNACNELNIDPNIVRFEVGFIYISNSGDNLPTNGRVSCGYNFVNENGIEIAKGIKEIKITIDPNMILSQLSMIYKIKNINDELLSCHILQVIYHELKHAQQAVTRPWRYMNLTVEEIRDLYNKRQKYDLHEQEARVYGFLSIRKYGYMGNLLSVLLYNFYYKKSRCYNIKIRNIINNLCK